MWFQCFVVISSGLLVSSAYLMGWFVRSRRASARFKKLSAGLPILERGNPLTANLGFEFFLGQNTSNKFIKWHEQYGKTFGFLFGERPCASTIDLDLIRLIIHDEQSVNRTHFNFAVPEFEDDSIFTAENDQWWRIRRAFGPPIRKFKLPSLMSEVEESIRNLIRSIENKITSAETPAAKLNLNDIVHRFTLDVVYRCLYKQNDIIEFEAERCGVADVIEEALKSPIDKPIPMKVCLVFPRARYLLDPLVKYLTQMGEWQRKIMGFILDQSELALRARQHLKAKSALGKGDINRDDFSFDDGTKFRRGIVDFIIDHYLDGKITRSEYLNSSYLLFSAADKTVCDALINIFYHLSVNQDVQEKLRNSILQYGLESRYMTWVIKEVLRLHPPAVIGCSRTIAREIKLKEGYVLPAGTYVHTPLFAIHRLREVWGQDADEFRPERWSDTSKFHQMQFIPFGAGRRGCPGEEFAMFEMKSLLVNLLSKFKLTGDRKEDISIFNSPYTLYSLPNSPTFMTVHPLGI